MAIAGSGKFTAVGAVVIGGHQEGGRRVNRFTVKGQILNAFRLRVNHLTLAVVSRRLGNINLVVYAVNHIKIVGAETVPVD